MGFIARLLGRSVSAPSGSAGPVPRAESAVYAVIDVETTGLSPSVDRIVDVAVVLLDRKATPMARWDSLLDPEGPMGATHIHGITADDVVGQPTFRQLAPHIASLLSGTVIVGHNVRFDLAFLRAEFGRAGWDMPFPPAFCTLDGSYSFLPDVDRRRLVDCCWAMGIRLSDAHSALGDAEATAAIFSGYLRGGGRQFWELELATLLAAAPSAAWPWGPARSPAPVAATPRQDSGHRHFSPARLKQPALVKQLAELTLTDLIDEGADDAALTYLETLLASLEDGAIDAAEADALDEVAQVYGLDPEMRTQAHRSFLLALAHRALDDGHVSREERAELYAVAGVLDVPRAAVLYSIAAADSARAARMSAGLRPLPADWSQGEPLRVGDKVVFTGCDDLQRERLERRAEELGVRVVGSVSRLTSLLVTDGAFRGGKAAKAEELGTRRVHPDVFEVLLIHLQPAVTEVLPRVPSLTKRSDSIDEPLASIPEKELIEGDAPPSQIRAWAIANGMNVGVRGRIGSELRAAFQSAHVKAR